MAPFNRIQKIPYGIANIHLTIIPVIIKLPFIIFDPFLSTRIPCISHIADIVNLFLNAFLPSNFK